MARTEEITNRNDIEEKKIKNFNVRRGNVKWEGL